MSGNVIPESNKIGPNGEAMDRIYGSITGQLTLILKDGSTYGNKIDKRSIKLSDNTLSYVYNADKKWFDRMGLPIDKPDNLVTRDKSE
jgi:hypothetical protein